MLPSLEAAFSSGLLGPPHFPFLPDKFPVAIAVVAVRPTKGCELPSGERARLGTGTGPTRAMAAFKASCEAVERYSIQYDANFPELWWPIKVLCGDGDPLTPTSLCLGAPGGHAGSIGCATGSNMDDAIDRAALELLEHHELARLNSGAQQSVSFDPATISNLASVADYLHSGLRHLRAEVVFHSGYPVVRAICCDPDGGRPTEGSAAAASIEKAATKAVEEAIFSWRNMIELERNGVPSIDGENGRLLRVFRGAEAASLPLPELNQGERPPDIQSGLQKRPLEALAEAIGQRIRVFDMTSPQLGLPVARLVLD